MDISYQAVWGRMESEGMVSRGFWHLRGGDKEYINWAWSRPSALGSYWIWASSILAEPFVFQEHVGAREMGDLTCLGFSETSQVWKIIHILTLWDLGVDSTEGKSWVVPARKERVNDRLPNTAEWLPFTIMFDCCCFKSWKSLKLPDTKDWYLNKAREGWRLFWFDHYIFLHCQTELPQYVQ